MKYLPWKLQTKTLFIYIFLQKNAKDENVSLSDAFLVKLEDCTGSLIADDWVISAAHCFEKMFNYGAGIINVR